MYLVTVNNEAGCDAAADLVGQLGSKILVVLQKDYWDRFLSLSHCQQLNTSSR